MSEQKNDTLDNLDYSIGSLDLDDLTTDKPANISDLDALFAEDQTILEKTEQPTKNDGGIDADFLSQLDDMSDLGNLDDSPATPTVAPKNDAANLDDLMHALDDIPVASADEQKITSTFEEDDKTTQNIPDPATLAAATAAGAGAAAVAAAKSEKPQGFFAKLFGKKDKETKNKNKPLFGNKKAEPETQHKSRLGKLKATTGIGKPKPVDTAADELQDLPNSDAVSASTDAPKQSKGFFSGRFGKKEKPITGTTFDTKEKTLSSGLGSMPDEMVNATKKPTNKASGFKAFGTTNSKNSKTKLTSGAKSGNGSKKSNALLIAGLACALAIAGAGYVFLTGDNAPAPTTASAPVPPPQPEQQPMDPSLQAPPADQQNPAMATDGMAAPNANQGVNPDEILNAQVPSDPALVKEEIDRLADTDSRLKEQGKIAEDQLQVMEKLTTAKAEQIALLEKQIAELEKQKNSVAIPQPEANTTQNASTPPPTQPVQ